MDIVFSADPTKLIKKCSEKLKELKSIKAPDWALYVKTGPGKDRPPVNPEWWYERCASILRKIYMLGPIGVSKLRTHYGAKKNKGVKPEHFYRASGNHIRKMLQQLESEGLVETVQKGVHKGRKISAQGQSFLRKIGIEVIDSEEKNKKEAKKEVKKEESKGDKKTKKAKADASKKKEKVEKSSKSKKKTTKKDSSSKSSKKSKKDKEAKT